MLLDPHTAWKAGNALKLPLLEGWLRHSLCLLHPQAALSLPSEPRSTWDGPCRAAAIPATKPHTGCRLHSTGCRLDHGGGPAAKAEQRHYHWTAWERRELISTTIVLGGECFMWSSMWSLGDQGEFLICFGVEAMRYLHRKNGTEYSVLLWCSVRRQHYR